MSKILKDVMSKVAKEEKQVELQAEKVELKMVDDVEAIGEQLEKVWKAGQSVRAKALREAKSKVDKELKKMNDMQLKAWRLINEFEAKASELGFDASKTNSHKKATKALKTMRTRIDELSEGFNQMLM